MSSESGKAKPLTNREKQLIRFLRHLEFGDIRIRVENGQPVLIYEDIKNFKLDGKTDSSKTEYKET
ncbi:hypothetical protein [Desulfoscipio gibsoniae]|uniref:Uncharacterized protein n=1 Tax=Desulfoscipio gibsoniae DSM 7213 TaxID=767817 RepID=R4KTU6_9FIRM|nr:hypothetical protein [Desulfoscipio gibsoniae]AGL03011.1 hypothetical protein Desgi_3689 [Desulfoscipio gibsoniae DSM 7213]